MPTVATILAQAAICQYLASNEYYKKLALKGGAIVSIKRTSRLIYIFRKTLDYIYTYNPTDPALIPTSNYLYWLCGKYNAQAAEIISGGGSGIIVNPSTGTASTIVAYYLQFVVGEVGSPMNPGDTVLVIPLSGFIENSVDVELDGVDLPINRNDRISFTVDYSNPAQVTITFNQGVSNGQLYEVRGWRLQPVASPAPQETFFTVATYADMIVAATGPYYKKFLVQVDEDKGQDETTYEYWPDQGIFWIAATEDTDLEP